MDWERSKAIDYLQEQARVLVELQARKLDSTQFQVAEATCDQGQVAQPRTIGAMYKTLHPRHHPALVQKSDYSKVLRAPKPNDWRLAPDQ